ncbi:MAG: hypothetical protein LW870_04945 [Pirellula sp.]|jgi:hypothetical protein|nr:hypothetical protein [Pirellula sp.]
MARLFFCVFALMVSACGLCLQSGLSRGGAMSVLTSTEAKLVKGGACTIATAAGNDCPGASGTCGAWGTGTCPAAAGERLLDGTGHLLSAELGDHDCAVGTCGVKCGKKKVVVEMVACVPQATGSTEPSVP